MISLKRIIISISLISVGLHSFAQEKDIEELLKERIIIENPVYKPVISLGSGVFNFHGDVRNNFLNPLIGNFGLKLNVSTFIDSRRYFKANFSLIYGEVSANQRSFSTPAENLNFRTDLVDFGVNVEYSFDHLIKPSRNIRPFISAGIENIQFSPKGDLYDRERNYYYYWKDGTIRNNSQTSGDINGGMIYRDYNYETDLREREKILYGLGSYSQNTFSFPVDAGLDFKISERIACRLGTSLHFTLTDFMDNVSSEGTHIRGKKGNDVFSYNYFMIRLDLFSQPKVKVIEKLFAEMETDPILIDDEDGDFILDWVDECPGTPYGVVVDSCGCPLDLDGDGVPDYLDEEPDTAPGAWVDDKGRTVTEEMFLSMLNERENAMSRQDLNEYLETINQGYVTRTIVEIPDKFKIVDKDDDGYISFEELLEAIDDYFDFKLNFSVEEIYELNDLFFQQ